MNTNESKPDNEQKEFDKEAFYEKFGYRPDPNYRPSFGLIQEIRTLEHKRQAIDQQLAMLKTLVHEQSGGKIKL